MFNRPRKSNHVGIDPLVLFSHSITEGQYKALLMLGSVMDDAGIASISEEQFNKYPAAGVRATYAQCMEVIEELIALKLIWRISDTRVQMDERCVFPLNY